MHLTNSLLHTLLVACDHAYKPRSEYQQENEALNQYSDSGNNIPITDNMPADWEGGLEGWVAYYRIDDSDTGFGATIYRKQVDGQAGKYDYIVALQGTRGPSAQDWNDNITYGWRKFYSEYGGVALIEYLTGKGESGILDSTNEIYFTGQSLGGALAQYTAYRYVDILSSADNVIVDKSKLCLVTFNGLGGLQGLRDKYENDFKKVLNESLLSGVETAHFYVKNDIVCRLGTGNLNGEGNEFSLEFQLEKDGRVIDYKPIDAHRIESGFYRGFNLNWLYASSIGPNDFVFLSYDIDHIESLPGIAGVAGTITTLFEDQYSGGLESFSKLMAGLIVGSCFGDANSRKDIVNAILEHMYSADMISKGQMSYCSKIGEKVLKYFVVNPGGLATLALSLIMASIADSQSSDYVQDLDDALQKAGILLKGMKTPIDEIIDLLLERTSQIVKENGLESRKDKKFSELFAAEVILAIPAISGVSTALVEAHVDDIFEAIKGNPSWIKDDFPKILKKCLIDDSQYISAVLGFFDSIVDSLILIHSLAGKEVDAFVTEKSKEIGEAVLSVSKWISNAIPDFAADYTDVEISIPEITAFTSQSEEVSKFSSSVKSLQGKIKDLLKDASESSALDEVAQILETAGANVIKAGQSIIIRAGGGNAYHGSIDPNAVAASSVLEGTSRYYTLSLPFQATEGGQKVKLTLSGTAPDALGVEVNGVVTALGADGNFELSVEEGQRELVFGFVSNREDVADQSFSLTATLLDGDGNATHQTHAELTIDFKASEEKPQQVSEAAREIVGDLEPIDFDQSDEGFESRDDELGNVRSDPTRESPGRNDILYDSSGDDHIMSREGDDMVSALRGGNDLVELGGGNDDAWLGGGNDIGFGGEGDDRIWGQAGKDSLEGGLASDILIGEEDEDFLYAQAAMSRADALVQNKEQEGSARKGDWLSGGDKDDEALGDAGDDVLTGGGGADFLVAGGGDDLILGDKDSTAFKDWTVTRSTVEQDGSEFYKYTISEAHLSDSTSAKEDALYGGSGNDWILGNAGDDFIDAGTDNDIVFGEEDNDTLLGEAGNDILIGDSATVAVSLHGDDYLDGGEGDDELEGGGGSDTLFGGAGNDKLYADGNDSENAGDDYLHGGDGNDELYGGALSDNVYGGAGADVIAGDYGSTATEKQGNDYLDGEEGDDQIYGLGGADTLYGGAGNDLLAGDHSDTPNEAMGDDNLDGEEGDDRLVGLGGADILHGGEGKDLLYGDNFDTPSDIQGNDRLDGGSGDDTLLGFAGNDLLEGGDGIDLLVGGLGDDEIDGGADGDQIAGDEGGASTAGGADLILGGAGDDLIDAQGGDDNASGGEGDDVVLGRSGADTLSGDSGADQLQGGEDDDTLDGGEGNDVLFGEAGDDSVAGGAGNDYLLGGTGDDTLEGGDGNDVFFYSRGDGVDHIADLGGTDWLVLTGINLSDFSLGVGSLKLTLPDGGEIHLDDFDPESPMDGAIEYFQFGDGSYKTRQQVIKALGFKIEGTSGDDELSGTALGEPIKAYDGDDVVSALAGDDTIELGNGDDWLDASDGADSVLAGDGADLVYGGAGNDSIDLGAGDDYGDGEDGSDSISAGPGADTILGGAGADTLKGGGDDDYLYGDADNDSLLGEDGNDLLHGGGGSDTLEGGNGDDVFVFASGDGQDVAYDDIGSNSIYLKELTADDLLLRRQGNDLVVSVLNGSDRMTAKNWFADAFAWDGMLQSDGTLLDRIAVDALLVINQMPSTTDDAVTLYEDGIASASGNVLANDYDPEGRTLALTDSGTRNGNLGSLSLSSDGRYTFSLDNEVVQSLADGQLATESYTYTVTDSDPAGAQTATASLSISVIGSNDAPVAAADSLQLTEDDCLEASGNLLTNDSDADAGTVLYVSTDGTSAGAYGSLILNSDGSYTYTLDNDNVAVQALGRTQSVTETFNYTVTDGIAVEDGIVQVTIAGKNDAPEIILALADQAATPNRSWTYQIPAGSVVDPDTGDALTWRATLADGTALPSWLTFDASTQTFSGRVPRTASGYLEIAVTATDSAADASAESKLSVTDVFQLSFDGTTHGGGNDGGKHGNEGVGNGEDAPPPGHDTNLNDGAGTESGSPGAQGGYGTPSTLDFTLDALADSAVLPELGGRRGSRGWWAADTASETGDTDSGTAEGFGVLPENIPALAQITEDSSQREQGQEGEAGDIDDEWFQSWFSGDQTMGSWQGNAWHAADQWWNQIPQGLEDEDAARRWKTAFQVLSKKLESTGSKSWLLQDYAAQPQFQTMAGSGNHTAARGNGDLSLMPSGQALKVFQGLKDELLPIA